MWLTVELLAALYLISFVWFWSLCLTSARKSDPPRQREDRSNLIPFERGLQMSQRKTARTM
ncbi:hypothetical protein HNQ77_000709 [Silvibacterium bohemicum]|uniref:Uncharacterized protein n=1 Tax=Silvibacterium bohemicum TaxID=1577686 RepID=A0A841JUU9_9BACT|nr:hypothetical protein [Silvibacterium bohemicum]